MTEYAAVGWRAAGACASIDPDLFFPISMTGKAAEQIARARRVRAGCRVRRECLDFALDTGETEGIWGGTTPDERIQVRRQRNERRRVREIEAGSPTRSSRRPAGPSGSRTSSGSAPAPVGRVRFQGVRLLVRSGCHSTRTAVASSRSRPC